LIGSQKRQAVNTPFACPRQLMEERGLEETHAHAEFRLYYWHAMLEQLLDSV
jgi:hypothetical protein